MTTPLTIKLPDPPCRLAIEGGLADDGWGGDMHIAIVNAPTSPLGQVRTITASVPAWLAFTDWLRDHAWTPPGATRAQQADARKLDRCASTIWAEFLKLAKHPAYRSIAIVGRSTTRFPAWRLGDGRWWPTPDMAFAQSGGELPASQMQQAVLVPKAVEAHNRIFTEWTAELI